MRSRIFICSQLFRQTHVKALGGSLAHFARLPTIELHDGTVDGILTVRRNLRAIRVFVLTLRLLAFCVG